MLLRVLKNSSVSPYAACRASLQWESTCWPRDFIARRATYPGLLLWRRVISILRRARASASPSRSTVTFQGGLTPFTMSSTRHRKRARTRERRHGAVKRARFSRSYPQAHALDFDCLPHQVRQEGQREKAVRGRSSVRRFLGRRLRSTWITGRLRSRRQGVDTLLAHGDQSVTATSLPDHSLSRATLGITICARVVAWIRRVRYLSRRIAMTTGAKLFSRGRPRGACSMVLGAFGAHALKAACRPRCSRSANRRRVPVLSRARPARGRARATQLPESALLKWSGWLMLAGICSSSGSLYALALSGSAARRDHADRCLGFLAAWAFFVAAVVKA